MYDKGPEIFVPNKGGEILIPRIAKHFTFEDAVERCESLGYVVIPKDKIQTLSFHVAITDMETRYGRAEAILSQYENKKENSFLEQLKQRGIIKYSQRVESKPCVTFHSWKMTVLN